MVTINDGCSDNSSLPQVSSRPTAELMELQDALSTLGSVQTFHVQDEIHATRENEKSLFLFTEGNFTCIRASDGLVISSIHAPMIYGIAECLRPRGGWFLKAQELCQGRVIPASQAFEMFTEKQLWQSVAITLSWYIQVVTYREEHLIGVTAYVMVRNKLLELNLLAPETRANVNVADYIQERTQLAHSTIMAILGELRRGDYVEIKRGKLMGIKHLPKEY